jgi:DegV family protein with EDD domain
MSRHVALVTDSTAALSTAAIERHGIVVVPLQVVIGSRCLDEGTEATPETVAAALRDYEPVSTSRPSPDALARVYQEAAAGGADAIVSVHLSGEVSGTYESAQLAAKQVEAHVEAVDTRQVGMGTGFAVLAAAEALASGSDAREAAEAASVRAAATRCFFYVDTLEYLRRGGRIGAAAALVGSALAVKPLLTIRDGRIGPLEKVRTSSRALARLEELAVTAARDLSGPVEGAVEVAVQHLSSAAKAGTIADRLADRLGLETVAVSEVGAVIGAHVGPGMVAVVVAPALD